MATPASHTLKGKAEPVHLWQATRVVAGIGGLMKSEGLEPPFVGRDRELKLVKDLFLASADDGRAHLVQVTGIAGIGKSRLSWEFFKYMDGLKRLFRWHRGRCLAYGEGVTYWALAEMVRGRAGITEGEDRVSAMSKLREAVEHAVPDQNDRRFVEPRLAHLLGLEERTASDKSDLFAGWRLFFERLAASDPVIMVFEDLQWADPSLLEFIDYLLDWSRAFPIFVMTLARPGHDTGLGPKRNATSISLDPLAPRAMQLLLTGLVPGLPAELTAKILDRAEGVPLYAVETVRMLLDRKLLVQEGPVYRPTGPVEDLEVPETLHALIAARLDGLTAAERRLVQDASVLGKTCTPAALAAVSGLPEREIEPVLAALVAKEVLTVQADPRSPERGQYGFVQDLVRTVAYETLPKKDRKAMHLSVASYPPAGMGSGGRERSSRWWPRTFSRRTASRPMRTTHRRSATLLAECSYAPAIEPHRLPHPRKLAPTSSVRPNSPMRRQSVRACSSSPEPWRLSSDRWTTRHDSSLPRCGSSKSPGSRIPPLGPRRGWPRSRFSRATSITRSRACDMRTRCSPAKSRTQPLRWSRVSSVDSWPSPETRRLVRCSRRRCGSPSSWSCARSTPRP